MKLQMKWRLPAFIRTDLIYACLKVVICVPDDQAPHAYVGDVAY